MQGGMNKEETHRQRQSHMTKGDIDMEKRLEKGRERDRDRDEEESGR